MQITTDEIIYYQNGIFKINATILFSWIVMVILVVFSIFVKKNVKNKKANNKSISTLQVISELVIDFIEKQINSGTNVGTNIIFPFISTLFLFIILANLISLLPFSSSPTGSLSTTVALAITTFIFTILIGIKEKGLCFFKKYFEPIFIMAPINIVGDIAKVVSMSIRLYGNITSTSVVIAIMLEITFLSVGFPVLINILSMISGIIQAYIFSTLAIMMMSLND